MVICNRDTLIISGVLILSRCSYTRTKVGGGNGVVGDIVTRIIPHSILNSGYLAWVVVTALTAGGEREEDKRRAHKLYRFDDGFHFIFLF